MSKMSQLNAMLAEQAYELGYESLEQALNDGWVVDYETQILTRKEYEKDEQEEAHKAWLKEKEECIRKLELTLENVDLDDVDNVQNAIDFIKGVKYES